MKTPSTTTTRKPRNFAKVSFSHVNGVILSGEECWKYVEITRTTKKFAICKLLEAGFFWEPGTLVRVPHYNVNPVTEAEVPEQLL